TYREQFDLVLSRAVAPINTLLEYCAPFTKVKGHIVLWKSMKIEQELKDSLLARAELSCHLTGQHKYELPESFGKRQLLIFEKTFKTSEKYPREIGIPKKKPIV
ncbi:MAG: RsmG family class I SAM-dependent methyltransferase, partial [Patescibacteria group bacterium]